jgi:hypothetical protein
MELAHRVCERNENRMTGPALIAESELGLPPIEQLERTVCVRYFIAEVIRPTAIGVDVIEMPMQTARQQPGDYLEIFVMMGGQPTCVALRILHPAAGGR